MYERLALDGEINQPIVISGSIPTPASSTIARTSSRSGASDRSTNAGGRSSNDRHGVDAIHHQYTRNAMVIRVNLLASESGKGDLTQIDNPYVDGASNGLSHAISKFRDQAVAAHVELTKCERSPLAQLACSEPPAAGRDTHNEISNSPGAPMRPSLPTGIPSLSAASWSPA